MKYHFDLSETFDVMLADVGRKPERFDEIVMTIGDKEITCTYGMDISDPFGQWKLKEPHDQHQ